MTVLTTSLQTTTPGRARLGVALFMLGLLLAPWLAGAAGGNYWVRVIDFALLYLMLALGLNIVVGLTGLLDMGFIAFYAVGAYLTALLSSPHLTEQFPLLLHWFPDGLHLSILLLIPLSAVLAALCGILLGAPTLRLRGDYLAIVTLGFGEIVRILMRNLDRPVNITNGPKGISGIDPVSLFGLKFSGMHEWFGIRFSSLYLYYYLFAALLLAILFICLRLQHSRVGRAWTAIREDEDAARAMGINTRNFKLLAFAIGATFGGIAGALFAAFQGFVSPESFTLQESIAVLAMVVLGGMGHIPGVILGALLLAALPELLRSTMGPLQQALFGQVWIDPEIIRQLFYGLALILVMLYRPAGLWPARHQSGAAS
ncbi:ABC transporter permease subunit [Serratia plymuthica]|uniref:ABC transporter ATP-binding protein n=1 Tax=Serratia plymuthica TaxID=82996 RepID=A0A2X4UQV9_SERPL|nr:ABC transporter ATP-binding protein [Serratia plymuthica]QPS20715.1 ABC transporter ATP-binding protein [Serratia plymuthica]QPS62328.1 ABC transporter ATP-binding protein [Serratia plymuthica]RKS65387.1 amino acid/amide ABC transporter membrane protein 2 (HAAT family) [Serratia plymuthica]UNK30488.1 ABC transporter ATP-binding protein [Serratia plymuthica]CAI2437312.1 LIV-I protein H [Serratia plymuthica]